MLFIYLLIIKFTSKFNIKHIEIRNIYFTIFTFAISVLVWMSRLLRHAKIIKRIDYRQYVYVLYIVLIFWCRCKKIIQYCSISLSSPLPPLSLFVSLSSIGSNYIDQRTQVKMIYCFRSALNKSNKRIQHKLFTLTIIFYN